MKRIAGFDYGERRIGVAISDPLKITAQPLDTILVEDEEKLPEILRNMFKEHDLEKVVVGLPLNMNGDEGETARDARQFGDLVQEALGIEVVMWDERLSSRTVELAMLEHNVRREKRKLRKDMMAAVVILQNYLDFVSG